MFEVVEEALYSQAFDEFQDNEDATVMSALVQALHDVWVVQPRGANGFAGKARDHGGIRHQVFVQNLDGYDGVGISGFQGLGLVDHAHSAAAQGLVNEPLAADHST